MIIEVEMHAFAQGAIRRVEIPVSADAFARLTKMLSENSLLGMTFQYGQNDFQPQQIPSVSVGDVIRLNGKRYAVLPVGFKQIADDFNVPHDGGMWAYALSTTQEERHE